MIEQREDVRLERSTDEIWTQVKEILSSKIQNTKHEGIIRLSQLIEVSTDEVIVGAINDIARTVIVNELTGPINEALAIVLKRPVLLKVVIDPSIKVESYEPNLFTLTSSKNNSSTVSSEQASSYNGSMQQSRPATNTAFQSGQQSRPSTPSLNQRYTFDTFVVGSHNKFCYSAARAVAEHPGQAYNPLFIYGGVGLGKTHLLQAIGNDVLAHSPNTLIRYISCERFTNELINSIRDGRMIEFRKRYRQVDILLVDDIQFILGKESTQEEFFHTFNALRDSGRQIVLSSDCPPKSLSNLEERLRSRFEWGLIADIQPPDFETRIAILGKKSETEGMNVPNDVLEYIASIYSANIRELEGALIRSHAYASLTGIPLTVESVAQLIRPGGNSQPKQAITIERIIETVAGHYRLESSDLKSMNRSQDFTLPRHIAMYLAHELIDMSFPRIGQAFSSRKHTSAIYAHKKIKEEMLENQELSSTVKQITHKLSN